MTWTEMLIVMADAEIQDAVPQESCRWQSLETAARLATARLILDDSEAWAVWPVRMATASESDPAGPPVVPPDDPRAPRVGSDPSIEPPSTAPEQVAPAGDPLQPPVPGWTTRRR